MNYWQLVRRQGATLAFGALHAACSGFGQTFFVALFVPALMAAHDLSRAGFSSLYAAATLASALLLPFTGRFIDEWPIRRYALAVTVGLACACLLTAHAGNLILLFSGLLMLRQCGQGLMAHISGTFVARHFRRSRGSALSLSTLGYPLAETTLPILTTLAMVRWGFAGSLSACALVLVGLVWPLGRWLLQHQAAPEAEETAPHSVSDSVTDTATTEVSWTRAQVLRSPAAIALLPLFNALACLLTGLFFHQLALCESKGWDAAWMAASFVGFGVARAAASFLVGPLIDRVGAARVMGASLVPLGVGLVVLIGREQPWAAPVYLALAGVSQGISQASRVAFTADTFGVAHLGAIKSFFGMTAVLSSAIAPPLFGYWLDDGGTFDGIVIACLGYCVLATALAAWAIPQLTTRNRSAQPS